MVLTKTKRKGSNGELKSFEDLIRVGLRSLTGIDVQMDSENSSLYHIAWLFPERHAIIIRRAEGSSVGSVAFTHLIV